MTRARASVFRVCTASLTLFALTSLTGCQSDCAVGGKHYAIGDTFRDSDSCNTCICTAEGAQCTLAECTLVDAGLQTADASAHAQCDEQTRRSSEALQAALSTLDNTCTRDADCGLLYLGSECFAGCGVVLSKQAKAAIEATAEAQADTVCRDFEAHGCKRIIPPCDGPGSIACVENQCRELPADDPG